MRVVRWVLIFAVILLVFTDTTKEDYIQWEVASVRAQANNALVDICMNLIGEDLMRNHTTERNFLVFSYYQTDLYGKKIKAIGIFNSFLLLSNS
ncbi:DUF4359 domain-containing protein [Fictibacillus sp. B-59209]|uniref:DUF4359 domain-containing protein n=1 Tax=Fictibacillus sp. B-59209 TaxID=3024873 RepID=UPI002E1B4097|nr:DUF4359 domain-containing protein [Fictibacillus sp. B-59209]